MTIVSKVAVITGAGNGIGKAVAQYFAGRGTIVIVAEIDEHCGLETVKEIEQSGGEAVFVRADVSDPGSVDEMVQLTVDQFGKVDILVNNAFFTYAKPLIYHTPEEWDRVFSVTVKGSFLCCKAVIPAMIRNGGGRIINVGSISGVVGLKEQGAYCPAKGAIHQMTRQLAVEHAKDGIRVNAVCPSVVTTKAFQTFLDSVEDREATDRALLASLPIGRYADPKEIAEAIGFFAFSESDYATGSILMFDGGYTAV